MTAHNKNNFDTDTEIKLWRPQRQPKLKNQNQKIRRPRNQKITSRNPKSKNRRGPKTQKKGQKHDKRQIMGKKHTKTHTKNTPPNTKNAHQKKPPILRPAGFAGRFIFRRRTSWRFAAEVCQKKISPLCGEIIFWGPPESDRHADEIK